MRKILILIRESNYEMEIDAIENKSFLPKECLETTSVEDFFESLKIHSAHFESIFAEAKSKDCRLKYVAEFIDGKANVSLQFIPKDHPFYNLKGKTTSFCFTQIVMLTNLY